MSPEALIGFAALVAAGVLLSALCSGVETGIYTLNRVRLALRVARGDRRALLLRDEIDHPNRLLAALLIANTIANDAVSIGISHLVAESGLGPIASVAFNTVIIVPLLFIFGEVLPKDLFRRVADRAVLPMAPLLRAMRLALTWCGLVPLVHAASSIVLRRLGGSSEAPLSSRQRLARLFEEGAGAGVLTEEQVSLAERVMGVAGRTVAERMVSWKRSISIRSDADARGRTAVIRQGTFSRYPVVATDGRVLGIVSSLDLLTAPERPVTELMRAPCWVEPGTKLLDALESMRRDRSKLAIVGDPARAPVGVISLSDLVEPLVGTFTGDL